MTGDIIKVPSHRRKPGRVASAATERVIKLAISKQSMSDGLLMMLILEATMSLPTTITAEREPALVNQRVTGG